MPALQRYNATALQCYVATALQRYVATSLRRKLNSLLEIAFHILFDNKRASAQLEIKSS
jgi:hypothetical protein